MFDFFLKKQTVNKAKKHSKMTMVNLLWTHDCSQCEELEGLHLASDFVRRISHSYREDKQYFKT